MFIREEERERAGDRGQFPTVCVLKCDHCLVEFTRPGRYSGHVSRLKRHYCSKECSKDSMRPGGEKYKINLRRYSTIEVTPDMLPSRKKMCLYCQCEFVDDSKSGRRKSCSRKCSLEHGVKTRKERGSYART